MTPGIDPVTALAAVQANVPAVSGVQLDTAAASGTAPSAFANLIQRQLGELDTNVSAAESAMRDLAAGKPVEMHDVMISLERAQISVQTFMQVRNKLIESYQDLMRLQL
jgi:flagellar hook-basal body complex protein FliE